MTNLTVTASFPARTIRQRDLQAVEFSFRLNDPDLSPAWSVQETRDIGGVRGAGEESLTFQDHPPGAYEFRVVLIDSAGTRGGDVVEPWNIDFDGPGEAVVTITAE